MSRRSCRRGRRRRRLLCWRSRPRASAPAVGTSASGSPRNAIWPRSKPRSAGRFDRFGLAKRPQSIWRIQLRTTVRAHAIADDDEPEHRGRARKPPRSGRRSRDFRRQGEAPRRRGHRRLRDRETSPTGRACAAFRKESALMRLESVLRSGQMERRRGRKRRIQGRLAHVSRQVAYDPLQRVRPEIGAQSHRLLRQAHGAQSRLLERVTGEIDVSVDRRRIVACRLGTSAAFGHPQSSGLRGDERFAESGELKRIGRVSGRP